MVLSGMVSGNANGEQVSRSGGMKGRMAMMEDLLSPAMSLTKICIVGSGSADGARLLVLLIEEMLLERIVPSVGCRGGGVGVGRLLVP